jgi:hypothetical protein
MAEPLKIPKEIEFEVKDDLSSAVSVLKLENISKDFLAYKVKTTAPKRYTVRPNVGVINPSETSQINVTMNLAKDPKRDSDIDKFQIQVIKLPSDNRPPKPDDKNYSDYFSKIWTSPSTVVWKDRVKIIVKKTGEEKNGSKKPEEKNGSKKSEEKNGNKETGSRTENNNKIGIRNPPLELIQILAPLLQQKITGTLNRQNETIPGPPVLDPQITGIPVIPNPGMQNRRNETIPGPPVLGPQISGIIPVILSHLNQTVPGLPDLVHLQT